MLTGKGDDTQSLILWQLRLPRVLAQDTPCILLDEPTAYLDPAHAGEFLELLLPLRQEKSILVVLHDLSLAARIADRVAVLEKGRLRFFGAKEDCLRQEVFETVFRVRRYSAGGRDFFGV